MNLNDASLWSDLTVEVTVVNQISALNVLP